MKRLIVTLNDGTMVNIKADKLSEKDSFFVAIVDESIVGAFDQDAVVCIYLSEMKGG